MKLVIFDFDGTIADTLSQVIEVANVLADKHGFKNVKSADPLKGLSVMQLAKELGVPSYRIPSVLKEGKNLMEKQGCAEIFPGMKEVLVELKKDNLIGVISSSGKKRIDRFVEKQGLAGIFDFIKASSPLLGKAALIRNAVREKGFSIDSTFYVGDEIRDIEAARKAGIKVISVAWGYNSKEALKKNSPDYTVGRPEEILDIIRKHR